MHGDALAVASKAERSLGLLWEMLDGEVLEGGVVVDVRRWEIVEPRY